MTSTSIYQEPVLSYVYRLDHPTTGEFYFGYRKANSVPASQDLGVNYFTSSKYVEPRFHEFKYKIIQEFKNPLEAYDLEQLLIYQELKNPLMMNRKCHYSNKSRFTTTGKSTSQETKDKISAKKTGVPRSQETKDKVSATKTGKKLKPRTAEHSAKISAGNKGISRGKGVPKSLEHNAKVSAALKDKPFSEEHKANLRVPKSKFFSIIETRKTYGKGNLSKWYPEFEQYY